MCGRYTLRTRPQAIVEHFGAELATEEEFLPRYNIAPTQQVPMVRERSSGSRVLVLARWGLIPSWAPASRGGQINARAETVHSTPMFRLAFQRRRCLVPADGYYEWLTRADSRRKQPFHLRLADDRLLAFAGVWERWQRGSERVDSLAIITSAACEAVRNIHDRMPVILARNDYSSWLSRVSPEEELRRLLLPYAGTDLVAIPVSATVNQVRNDTPACLDPVTLAPPEPTQLHLF